MTRKEVIGNATLYLGDCNDILPSFGAGQFDLACVDPPYFDGPNKSGYYGKGYSSLGVQRAKHYDTLDSWEVPSPQYFKQLVRVSKEQIIWGANHFCDRFAANAPGWLIWDKLNGASSFADAELAFCSVGGAARVFRYVWNGMHQGQYGGDKSKNEPRIHPTQKPVALYEWIFDNYCSTGALVLDTHLGSGSIAVAANNRGIDLIAIEKDPAMFDAACRRIDDAQRQGRLIA